MAEQNQAFDFKAHEQAAVVAYLERRGFFEDLAGVVKRIIEEALKRRGIKVHSVQSRAKDPRSYGRKASQPLEADPAKPKYANPLREITDLAGVRVITYFPGTLEAIDKLLDEEFQIVERSDKGAALLEEDRFGYQSIHYLVRLAPKRTQLSEYQPFVDAITEVQVRTILQHAWAEIEHDIQYKSASVTPTAIRRRFVALAGVLEMADREFQAIQNEDKRFTEEARSRIEGGQLGQVEITPDAVKAFLDQKLGPDGRMNNFSYQWTARLLRRLGFSALDQVERCIDGYHDDQLSRIASGARQGQISRFEYMLLAGMGENFIRRHFWASESWFGGRLREHLKRFKEKGIEVREYDPSVDQAINGSNEST